METVINLKEGKFNSFTLSKHPNERFSTAVWTLQQGWVHQFEKKETIYEILKSEISHMKFQISKSKRLKKHFQPLIKLLKLELQVQSQLTLF